MSMIIGELVRKLNEGRSRNQHPPERLDRQINIHHSCSFSGPRTAVHYPPSRNESFRSINSTDSVDIARDPGATVLFHNFAP
jgi:hypothetical protein